MTSTALPTFMTISDVARELGVARALIRKAVRRGELRPYVLDERWKRLDVDEVREWLASKRWEES